MEIKYPNRRSKDARERSLGMYVSNLRQRYKKGLLSKQEINLIESLPGWKWEINKPQIIFTKKEVEDFIEEWKKSDKGIMEFFKIKGINNNAFYKAVKEFNIKYNENRIKPRTKKDIECFIKEFEKSNKGIVEFCKDKGIRFSSFYRSAKKFNLEYGDGGVKFKTKKEVEDFIKEFEKSGGRGIIRFCKGKGIDYYTFRNAVKRFNIEYKNETKINKPIFKTKKDIEDFVKEFQKSGKKTIYKFCKDKGIRNCSVFYNARKKYENMKGGK